MTNKDIQQLIDKYLEGNTSPQEERTLAHELLRPDIPEEWQAVRLMLGELAMGEAEYDSIMSQRNTKPSAILIALRIISKQPAPQPAYCTEGTPREILMCYVERRKAQPHIYQQLKQKIYENQ